MNIAIISSLNSPNTADLLRAARQVSIACNVYALKDLAFAVASLDDHPFFAHDVYIFRGYNKSYTLAQSLVQSLIRRKKVVIDKQLGSGFVPSKFHEALVYKDSGVAHIATYTARSFDALVQAGFSESYPVVVKQVDSQQGRGVRLCHDETALRSEIEQNGERVIVQHFITIDYDVRVICIGNQTIGAIKRESAGNDFRTNVSLGGKASVYHLSQQEKDLALQAHRALGYDVSGVDIGHDSTGMPLVIETNITPQWQGFVAATGIDVAAKIIEYAIERYDNERI